MKTFQEFLNEAAEKNTKKQYKSENLAISNAKKILKKYEVEDGKFSVKKVTKQAWEEDSSDAYMIVFVSTDKVDLTFLRKHGYTVMIEK